MTGDDEMNHLRAAASERSRLVSGDDGRQWVVREVAGGSYDRRGTTTLVFTTDDAMRRVRQYPANWFDLPNDALYALSNGR
jgi:hypothetical protein